MRTPCFLIRLLAITILPLQSISSQLTTDPVNASMWTSANIVEISMPPGNVETLKELVVVKNMVSMRDEKIMQTISYWDAGAPSYRWNQIGYQLAGPELFRAKYGGNFWKSPMAWMNIAIYDATLAARKYKGSNSRQAPYELDKSILTVVIKRKGTSFPCEYTLTAAAAATVLSHFFPSKADSLLNLAKEASQSRIYAGVQYPSDVEEGWKLGEKIAKQVIELSNQHGSLDKEWQGKVPDDPKLWSGPYPVGAITLNLKPLMMTTPNQFRPGPPPDFAKEMKEIKNLEQNFYTTSTAFKWASLSGLDFWTDMASTKIFEYHLENDALAAAQVYTVLHIALHDAAIAIMDGKYAYWGTRPDQYDRSFKPLLGFTPPFPGYPSGHATASSLAATVLSHFFPADRNFFNTCAKECADSRFYAGIHFPTDNKVGLEVGENLGNYVVSEWKKRMQPNSVKSK